ncbi:DUF2798 domain-containing protein [Agrilutibacter solisilvae]|uniref:DUF2798 domain-containing protein n=1 Tax=Agrilutibacter solisilvae TaxID=2763317 RepID=A0A974XZW4_9GAMM|nr:DUF2798 domain-containing protein [Lysobacter solisilvae]QSX78846.1 DUF2798 domain-containing protein [Lysobacter solisilvae]
MLTPRQAQFAFVPLMVTVMSGVISLAMTVLHAGPGPGLLQAWLANWALAFVIALPVAWVTVPAVRTLLSRLTSQPPAARELGDMG